MCGILAYIGSPPTASQSARLERALELLQPRGPDAWHTWSSDEVWLGHRRLAIIDLDRRAEQPMHSRCGRYTIIFNGEIYNYTELRDRLNSGDTPYPFETQGDTEVLLAMYARFGASMLQSLRGMFAFVIWDHESRTAFLARDPYGIKPLYLGTCSDGGFLVSSQVRAIVTTGLVSTEPSATGQAGYWLLGSVPEPHTWFRDIVAVPAGHYVVVDARTKADPVRWWDISDDWRAAGDSADLEAFELCRRALDNSVAAHMISDVPVGLFLSGGIDSGSIAGLMRQHGAGNLQGVTISFDEFAGAHLDESPAAALLARCYGIEHHVKRVTASEFEADIDRIANAMDQPTVDGVNTWYASKAAAEKGLKVVMSGVGGDELFHGYGLFTEIPRLIRRWNLVRKVPAGLDLLQAVCNVQALRTGRTKWRHLPDWASGVSTAWWLRRGLHSPEDLPSLMGRDLAHEALATFSPQEWIGRISGRLPVAHGDALAQIESTTYLRNQLLRDSDWASMDHSVELRTPLVDAWLLRELRPVLAQFSRHPNKQLLLQAPRQPIPGELVKRPKSGFGIPIQDWSRRSARTRPFGSWATAAARMYEQRWQSSAV